MRTEKEPRERPLQAAATKIIIPIAETSNQEVQTSTALRISYLQNELRLLQKSLQEQSDLTSPANSLSRRTSFSLDSTPQSENVPLPRSSLSSRTHSKSHPQTSPRLRPALQTYSQPQLALPQDYSTSNLNDLESLKISQSLKPDSAIIMKPTGNQSKKVRKVLDLSKPEYKAYRGNLRDLIKAGLLDLNSTWKKQDTKQVLRLIKKFKEKNPQFPKTANDWAIKEIARGIINNRREYIASEKKKKQENQFECTQQKTLDKVSIKDLPEDKRSEKELNKENESEILEQSEYTQHKMSDNNRVSAKDFMPEDSDSDFYELKQQFRYGPNGGESSTYSQYLEEDPYTSYQESESSEFELSANLHDLTKKPTNKFAEIPPEQPEATKKSVKEYMKRPSEKTFELARKFAKNPVNKPPKQPEQPEKKIANQPSKQSEQPVKKHVKQLPEQLENHGKKLVEKPVEKEPLKQSAKQPPEQPLSENKKRCRSTKQLKNSENSGSNHPKRKSTRISSMEPVVYN